MLENDQFLGKHGLRTIFLIECQNGKSVVSHSYFKDSEQEIILMPGSYFEVVGQLNPAEDLHIIQVKEIQPPFALIKPPFTKAPAPSPVIQPPSSNVISFIDHFFMPTVSLQFLPKLQLFHHRLLHVSTDRENKLTMDFLVRYWTQPFDPSHALQIFILAVAPSKPKPPPVQKKSEFERIHQPCHFSYTNKLQDFLKPLVVSECS